MTKVRRDLILNIIFNFILYKPNFEIRIYIFLTLEKGAIILFNRTRLTTKNLEKSEYITHTLHKNPINKKKILHLDKTQ